MIEKLEPSAPIAAVVIVVAHQTEGAVAVVAEATLDTSMIILAIEVDTKVEEDTRADLSELEVVEGATRPRPIQIVKETMVYFWTNPF